MLLMVLVAGYLVTTQPSFLFLTSPSAHSICYPPLCPLATFSFVFSPHSLWKADFPSSLLRLVFPSSCLSFSTPLSFFPHSPLPFIPRSEPLFSTWLPARTKVLSLPICRLSLHPPPLISMRLARPPRSASLSPSEREEAAYCQGLMDFWNTQTAMHHSLQTGGGGIRRKSRKPQNRRKHFVKA